MNQINKLKILFVFCIVASCSLSDNDDETQTLAFYLKNGIYEKGAVIACAATDKNTDDILTFFYPPEGAERFRFYETSSAEVDPNDFSNYGLTNLESTPVFNGYLRKFIISSSIEKWIIITFQYQNEIKISNPIRAKQLTKPTVWNDIVDINQERSINPIFEWPSNAFGDNDIYFQVISDADNNLLSGTYTVQNAFQYYNTVNVVLNITTQVPPQLLIDNFYNFTLMDVSADNWVNLVTEKMFQVE